MRAAGVPVTVLERGDAPAVTAVATMSGADHAVAADGWTVSGLERAVVVWLQGGAGGEDEDMGRLHAMSRCTGQLVWVRRP